MDKVRVAIVGAAGYAGEELLRLLSRHPYADIRVITSRQNAGKDIAEIFPRLAGTGLSFSMPDVEAIKSGCRFPGAAPRPRARIRRAVHQCRTHRH